MPWPRSSSASPRPATSTRVITRAGTTPATRHSSPIPRSRTGSTPKAATRWNGCRSRATSSVCRHFRTVFSSGTVPTPSASGPRAGTTKSSVSSKAGSRICRSPAPRSPGVSPTPATRTTWSMSGSTPSPTTSRRSASGTMTNQSYATFWPASLHLVGKDILRFHCVYWPAFLMSAGLPLPERVFGHGWWLQDDAKMSKSVGNVVRPDHLIHRFGADALRYFVAREMSFGQDANFSDEAFLERFNADLANSLGNTASRTTAMTTRIPRRHGPDTDDRGPGTRSRRRCGRKVHPPHGRPRTQPGVGGGLATALDHQRLSSGEAALESRQERRRGPGRTRVGPLRRPRGAQHRLDPRRTVYPGDRGRTAGAARRQRPSPRSRTTPPNGAGCRPGPGSATPNRSSRGSTSRPISRRSPRRTRRKPRPRPLPRVISSPSTTSPRSSSKWGSSSTPSVCPSRRSS